MQNQSTVNLLFWLFRSELLSQTLPEDVVASLSEEEIQALYRLSKLHDLAHIAGDALTKAGVLHGEAARSFQKWQYLAVYRYQRSCYELSELRRVLTEEKIPFMPLKGTVLREHYPDPVMRTSVDIDILVHPEDLERVKTLLTETLHYRPDVEGPHDVGFFTASELHVEIHYALCDDTDKRALALGDPWENCRLKDSTSFEYEMTNEFFYAYAMAHAAKHFYIGGCGIRPFMDMVIMKEKMPFDTAQVMALFEKADLSVFAEYAEKLCDFWFFDGERDDTIDFMVEYLLEGGTYGSMEGYIISIQGEKSGAYYMIRKIFMPYRNMKEQFPILKKLPILLPFCHVVRWFAIIFSKRRKGAAIQMRASRNLNREKTKRIVDMQKKLHLD